MQVTQATAVEVAHLEAPRIGLAAARARDHAERLPCGRSHVDRRLAREQIDADGAAFGHLALHAGLRVQHQVDAVGQHHRALLAGGRAEVGIPFTDGRPQTERRIDRGNAGHAHRTGGRTEKGAACNQWPPPRLPVAGQQRRVGRHHLSDGRVQCLPQPLRFRKACPCSGLPSCQRRKPSTSRCVASPGREPAQPGLRFAPDLIRLVGLAAVCHIHETVLEAANRTLFLLVMRRGRRRGGG
jgi:hypothetical protein